jgi:cell division protein FtsZ
MDDFQTITSIIHDKVRDDALIKIGLVEYESLGETIMVTVIATGFGNPPPPVLSIVPGG